MTEVLRVCTATARRTGKSVMMIVTCRYGELGQPMPRKSREARTYSDRESSDDGTQNSALSRAVDWLLGVRSSCATRSASTSQTSCVKISPSAARNPIGAPGVGPSELVGPADGWALLRDRSPESSPSLSLVVAAPVKCAVEVVLCDEASSSSCVSDPGAPAG